MLRHRLAALFEPRSVLVVADCDLPVMGAAPRWLQSALTCVRLSGASVSVPETLAGVASGARVDQAVVCVAHDRLPDVLDAVRVHRPRVLVVLATRQPSPNPVEDMAYCQSWARLNQCIVLGPRAFGVQRPHLGLNLTHQPSTPMGGRVALLAQSRSITSAVLDWAEDISMGFSAVASPGDESGVDIADLLDYLALDVRTDSIVLYLEETSSSRKFTSALRAAAGVKPVVVLKVGDTREPSREHEAVFNALLRRAGAVRVQYFIQLFSALKVLVYTRRPRGRKIALFSNGSGPSRLALDVMGEAQSVFKADLALNTVRVLREALEPGAETANPVITYAGLTPEVLRAAVGALVADPGVDGVLVVLAPDPLADLAASARELAAMSAEARKPIVTCLMGDARMRDLRHLLDNVGTPAFRTPESAASAFGILGAYHYNQTLAQQILPPEPLGLPPRVEQARRILRQAQTERRRALTDAECWQVMACFNLPPAYEQAGGGAGATEHGSDDHPDLAVHVRRDSRFGPYIVFGSAAELSSQSGSVPTPELPPLNRYLARQLVQRSQVWRQTLSREITPFVFEHLLEALEHVSELISELPDIETLIIDPVRYDDNHLTAVRVRITLSQASMLVLPETAGYQHMAIHPYPRHLVRTMAFHDGSPWLLRPIRPEDAEPLQTFVRELSDESRYMRFVSMLRELTPRMLARYTRIDYDRELALIATVNVPNPELRGRHQERIIGFAHYLRNPDGRGAEYALVIADDWQRHGLGNRLMTALIHAAQDQGLTYIDGLVLANNRPMLALMTSLGFQVDNDEEDPGMRRVWLDLGETRSN